MAAMLTACGSHVKNFDQRIQPAPNSVPRKLAGLPLARPRTESRHSGDHHDDKDSNKE
jgi:hypothetical protein